MSQKAELFRPDSNLTAIINRRVSLIAHLPFVLTAVYSLHTAMVTKLPSFQRMKSQIIFFSLDIAIS